MKRIPWVTLILAAATVAIHCAPGLGNTLQFDRDAIAAGQVWRFFTAHLTHFGGDHLRWDLLAFGVLGWLAEHRSRRGMMTTLVASAALITLAVWIAQPQFTTYRGLSGIDSALFGFIATDLVVVGWRERHRFSMAVGGVAFAAFGAKCVYELITGATVFVATADTFAPVPMAHIVGLVGGMLTALCGKSKIPSIAQQNHGRATISKATRVW